MTATLTLARKSKHRSPKQAGRTCRCDVAGKGLWFVTLNFADGSTDCYSVQQVPQCDINGVAYTFAKHNGTRRVYTVVYEPESDGGCCNCDGHKHGYRCRHVAALAALLSRGRLS